MLLLLLLLLPRDLVLLLDVVVLEVRLVAVDLELVLELVCVLCHRRREPRGLKDGVCGGAVERVGPAGHVRREVPERALWQLRRTRLCWPLRRLPLVKLLLLLLLLGRLLLRLLYRGVLRCRLHLRRLLWPSLDRSCAVAVVTVVVTATATTTHDVSSDNKL